MIKGDKFIFRLSKSLPLFCIIVAALFLIGCAAETYRMQPDLEQKANTIKNVVLLPPKVDVYELGAGDVREKMDDWSEQASKNVVTSLSNELQGNKQIFLSRLTKDSLPDILKGNLLQTQNLYDAVSGSILTYTEKGKTLGQDNEGKYRYCLGSEIHDLAPGAEAVLVVRGVDNISTAGRAALEAGKSILGAIVGIRYTPRSGVTFLDVSLVDANNGSVLWYNYAAYEGSEDLRKQKSVDGLVKKLFKEFPIKKTK
jgi:hypothetical protein